MTIFITKGDWHAAGRPAPLTAVQAYQRGERHLDAMLPEWERKQAAGTSLPEPLRSRVEAWAASSDPALAAFGAALVSEGSYSYAAFTDQWVTDNQQNDANNVWNWQLFYYLRAEARLARYRLADGRPEITEQVETGEFDPNTGDPITETVVVQTAIDPLPAEIDQVVWNEELQREVTVQVANPAITEDDAERADAQATIDATPQDVIDYAAQHQEG